MSTTFKGSYWTTTASTKRSTIWHGSNSSLHQARQTTGLPEALRAISRIGVRLLQQRVLQPVAGVGGLRRRTSAYTEYTMDSYYEDLVDYLRDHTPHNLHKEFRGGCKPHQVLQLGRGGTTLSTASSTTSWSKSLTTNLLKMKQLHHTLQEKFTTPTPWRMPSCAVRSIFNRAWRMTKQEPSCTCHLHNVQVEHATANLCDDQDDGHRKRYWLI